VGAREREFKRPSLNATTVRTYSAQGHDGYLSPHPHGGNGRAFKARQGVVPVPVMDDISYR